MSRIYGHTTIEWPYWEGRVVPVQTAAQVEKPLENRCKCWDLKSVAFVGRYGRWEKGVLSHTSYFDTRQLVSQKLTGLAWQDIKNSRRG